MSLRNSPCSCLDWSLLFWDRRIARCLEPIAHLLSLADCLGSNSVALTNTAFNPVRDLPGWCWFADNPPFCSQPDNDSNNDTTCLRGHDYDSYVTVGWSVTAIWGIIIVCIISIVLKVRQMENRFRLYAVNEGDGGSHTTSTTTTMTRTTRRRRGNEPTFPRTKATAKQSLLYIAAFFITYGPLLILIALPTNRDNPSQERRAKFYVAILVKLCTPL